MAGRLPSQIAWRHVGAREGFEVTFTAAANGGLSFTGTTSALEDGRAWTVSYHITVDPVSWATRSARVSLRTVACVLAHDDTGLLLDYPGIAVRVI